MYMALIQEPWYCEGHIMGRNIPGYILFSASGIDRPTTRFLAAVEKFPKPVSEFIQWALHTVVTWCEEVGLSVNLDKTGSLYSIYKEMKTTSFIRTTFFVGRGVFYVAVCRSSISG